MKHFSQILEDEFYSLHLRAIAFVEEIPDDDLFKTPSQAAARHAAFSSALLVVRSAGTVEQTFGGITARLWDDPFEWTLPEELSTGAKIIEYLRLVEGTRRLGFSYLKTDEDLIKMIPAPDKLVRIGQLLVQTIARAEYLFGQACLVRRLVSGDGVLRPGVSVTKG